MKKSIKETVKEAIEPTVTELGYRIWDVTYSKIGADYHLEITIDKDGGIDIQDCERVHRAVDPILDEADPIESFYYLEVSSPGLERELKTPEHLAASVGETVEVRLFAPRDGVKSFTGTLGEPSESGEVAVETADGTVLCFKPAEIAKISTVYVD